ncbi:MAG: hypothetical protein Q8O13_04445 [Candidatus Omnitrophota bacterium]|nr:hypothetical protein [Candidatus Omnitrophota bacterium]
MYYSYIRMGLKQKSKGFYIFLVSALLISSALESLAYAISLKDQAKDYREKGYNLQLVGDTDSALAFYQKAISLDPSFVAVYNDLGIVSEMHADIERSEYYYLKAIELDHSYLAAYSNLAYLYEKKGDFLKAALFLKRRIEKGFPADLWTKKAKDNLRRLSLLSKEVKDMLIQEEVATFESEFSQQLYTRKINDFGLNVIQAKEHFEKGFALLKQNEFSLALEEFKKAKRFTPDDKRINLAINNAAQALIDTKVNAYVNEGLKYYRAGDAVSARNEFKKLLAIIPASNQKSQ